VGADLIHATAVIDPRAELARGVQVGPGSVIGPDVRIGEGTVVGAHVVLEGRVGVGARCRIGHGAVVGAPPQDLKYRPGIGAGVRIGQDTVIREYVTIHHATTEGADTQIGDHCMLMAQSHVAHDAVLGHHVVLVNYAGVTGHARVDDHAIISGFAGIHPFGRVGTYAYVGGYSKVTQDVPPFVIADGNPAVARAVNVIGMRRGGIAPEGRRQVQRAFRILYRSGLKPGAALARIAAELGQDPLVAILVAFIRASKRGIVSAPARWADAGDGESEEATS
jgi:UDP-N-acetylglucosamine acyltransferase